MTLDEWYVRDVGKSLLIPGGGDGNQGQCVQLADTVLHDVYGQPYHWGNAIDWWNNPGELLNKFDKITDGSVKKGDFVIFNEKVGSVYGHIDVAMQDGTTANFQGADSNWGGNKTVHLVQHAGSQYVLGSLRLKGGDVADQQQINDLNARIDLQASQLKDLQSRLDGALSELDNERKGYDMQIADLKAQLAGKPTDPNTVTVTKDGFWAAFKRFLGIGG